ncbi:AAA family ATPase [Clostridium sp. ZS2-4]|uniref:AAA family ATPase n=1 Tax=Clostridium sp. ZS2-4 TaxID=2987703 RepID=UPI00227ADD38|nr:AAA family ATPase [Clostridium sp. ZS2-4]MCY6354029.1 AAA family ATPase [Clostridium sp. ZS2-4]
MSIELLSQDAVYKFDVENINLDDKNCNLPEYTGDVYDKIESALNINKEGYNIFLIDDFSKNKLNNIKDFINKIFKYRDKPQDIVYVINEDPDKPFPLFLSNGKGIRLKETVEELQEIYIKASYEFYTSSVCKEKEEIIENIQKKRNELITELMDSAHDKGFEIRSTNKGFTFIPLKGEEIMTEREYDELDAAKKEEILNKVSELKNKSQKILEGLKDIELTELVKIKKLMEEYLSEEAKEIKGIFIEEFENDTKALQLLEEMTGDIEKDICENYSMVYEDDEDRINEIIIKYDVNVLVDNSKCETPGVIFEEDPSITNLLGSIEYKNQNGTYVTDVSLIKAGSILKANEGCLIIRANSLLANANAYYNLKKTILSEKVSFDSSRGYIELLSLRGLEPEPLKIKEKIIMIGDYETYDILYNYDDDFRKIFKIKAQYRPIVEVNDDTKVSLLGSIQKICNDNKLNSLDKGAIREVAKFLSRKAEHKEKILFNDEELSKILMLSNNKVICENRDTITAKDIIDIAYMEDLIEKEIREVYKEDKILLKVKDKQIGQINGLSVLDSGYFCFGKPIRITCSCYKGEGEIIDVQKQSELSGNIHCKAVNILKGLISELFGKYNRLPVNFHLSFEQIYGKIDGDSASVAELVCMISALSNISIKQNIAVTGSLNQFGEVQPIGGVNEKIEGFFKICKEIDNVHGKGVLIPYQNKNNIVLNREVEKAIEEGKFHIYVMKNIEDAIEVLMSDYRTVISAAKKELKKYGKKTV